MTSLEKYYEWEKVVYEKLYDSPPFMQRLASYTWFINFVKVETLRSGRRVLTSSITIETAAPTNILLFMNDEVFFMSCFQMEGAGRLLG